MIEITGKETEQNKLELINELSLEVNACKKCDLWKTRTKPLVGEGNVNADILIVGESPGYYEDIQGKAFVGKAGTVLDQLLDSINLGRNKIYITNVLKCHPPRNHDPNRQEIDSCINYLKRQITILKPKVVVTLGKFASEEVFKMFNLEFSTISKLHGKVFDAETNFGDVKIISLFHPAVACYHAEKIDVLKEDFKNVGEALR